MVYSTTYKVVMNMIQSANYCIIFVECVNYISQCVIHLIMCTCISALMNTEQVSICSKKSF